MSALATRATAAPHGAKARAAFDRGVKAYTSKHYEAAARALARSYELEHDTETLFAWAQTERKLDRCDKAVELYRKLLDLDLPAANKRAVQEQLDECTQILAAQAPPAPSEPPTPAPPPAPDTTSAPAPAADAAPPPAAPPSPASSAPVASVTASPEPSHAWWRDPVGDGLVVTGAAGVGVGVAMLLSGQDAARAESGAKTYPEAQAFADKAHLRGEVGVIATAAGGALLVTGIVWYATHRHHAERPAVSAWLAPGAGGLAVTGGF